MYKDIKTIEDLEFLKNNKISEDIHLDYKLKLPELSNDVSRLDFLRDVCSFANTYGGQIIFGIDEIRGKAIPKAILGVNLSRPDHDIRQLIEIVRNGLEEVISDIHFQPISISENEYVVVLRIPMSSNAPHRVKASLDKDHRFYGRNSLCRYELSFSEIRDKFMKSSITKDKIREFRADRVKAINQGNIPSELQLGPKVVLHIIPFSAFSSNFECDIPSLKKLYMSPKCSNWFSPLGRNGDTSWGISLEGFFTHSKNGYALFYREGMVEAVTHIHYHPDRPLIFNGYYEEALLKQEYLKVLSAMGFTPPFCIFLSLIEIDGYAIAVPSGSGLRTYNPSQIKYNKPEILLKEVILESYEDSLDVLFKPLFDRFCSAWSFEGCPSYAEDGKYILSPAF